MTSDEIRNLFRAITVWRRGGERASHKPLLALYAIGRVLQSDERMIPYTEIDRELGKLLVEFGPRRQWGVFLAVIPLNIHVSGIPETWKSSHVS